MITRHWREKQKFNCFFCEKDGTCRRPRSNCYKDNVVSIDPIERPRPISQNTELPAELTINGVVYVKKGE